MKTKKLVLIITSVMVFTLLVIMACDKRVLEVQDYSIQNIYANPDTIYADYNPQTYSEINVTVVDKNDVPLVGQTVTFKILGQNIGNITASSNTGNDGVAVAQFNDIGLVGVATVEASIAGSKATVNISIMNPPPPEKYYIAQLLAAPDSIYADNNDATYSEIRAFLIDENGFPAVGDSVFFQTNPNLGYVTAFATADQYGIATAQFRDIGIIGDAVVQAYIPDSTTTVIVRILEPPTYHIERITAEPDTIYADNNITFSEIEVLVKDEQGFAVTGEMVSFRTDIGNILAQIYTDSSGVAVTTFWDNGEVGVATIEAFVGDTFAEVTVWIEEIPEIDPDEFYLDINSNDINIDEVILVRAHAKNTLGEFVPDGTIIVFQTTKGFFQTFDAIPLGTVVQATTTSGVAQTYFNAGTQAGISFLDALISDLIVTDSITIHPGSPINMFLTALDENGIELVHPYTIPVNSNEVCTIQAKVQDKYGNLVESGLHSVNFETTLGTIQPAMSPIDSGYAYSEFSPGITSGIAEISAVSDSASANAYITVTSDDVYSIEFAYSDQIDIHIAGTGGQESFELIVYLLDMNGNLVNTADTVYFKFINAPNGTNLNNLIFWPTTDSISTIASNGQAVAVINSGDTPGTVCIKAYTYNLEGAEIQATKSNIVVHAGPANSIDITIGEHSTGVDMGGGVWQIQCAAFISDYWGNPVDHGTAVWFSLEDSISWASINAAAYVGNVNASGDSLQGVAYTFLDFEGTHTNDTLLVKVECSGIEPGQTYNDSSYVIMPIQYPVIDMIPIPGHVDWAENIDPEWHYKPNDPECTISPKVYVIVRDGQNNLINNQIVAFYSTLGTPVLESQFNMQPYNPSFTPDDFDITGPDNDGENDGEIIQYYRFYRYECPEPSGGPSSITATITAHIFGTQIMNTCNVILTRYPY